MSNTNSYESPFCTRYASPEMQYLFSADKKFTTWRRLWVALARAEHKLGLPVTQAQVEQLEANVDNIDYDVAREREKVCRHDVMSHVYAYGVACPEAKGIIHLGATSCYVGDNTDIIIMRDALQVVRRKLINVVANLARFADSYKAMPALAYTHLQPAQLTTVGKRATLWINELLMDLEEIEHRIASLKLLGSKGTTGTQASFVVLFDEIEKAHPDVFNVLLQVLDDGRITDSQGRTVDFKNTILIMTSNIGANYLLEGIDEKGNISADAEKLVMEELRAHFRPEFLHRLDEMILFKPLTKDNIGGIIHLIVEDLNERLSDREISIELTEEAERFIVDNAYDPVYGARPLKRYIQKYVETLSAKVILADAVAPKDVILVDVENGELIARKK